MRFGQEARPAQDFAELGLKMLLASLLIKQSRNRQQDNQHGNPPVSCGTAGKIGDQESQQNSDAGQGTRKGAGSDPHMRRKTAEMTPMFHPAGT